MYLIVEYKHEIINNKTKPVTVKIQYILSASNFCAINDKYNL